LRVSAVGGEGRQQGKQRGKWCFQVEHFGFL
jgi:hypothetical protein